MKVAISGKGGVGKTTLCATLARLFADEGREVYAIDADPDSNLASALGYNAASAPRIEPLVKMKQLIVERTGASPDEYGKVFKLNPEVADLPEKYSVNINGVKLMVLGTIYKGGSGCACPENTLLRSLMLHFFLERDANVLLDMEAGIEHLGRATAQGVEHMIVVVEPGQRSVETAMHVRSLAADIGIKKVSVVGNKFANESQRAIIRERIGDMPILGFISYNDRLVEADLANRAVFDDNPQLVAEVRTIKQRLEER
ncbi:MAG: carbon monoxide dehydrogenase accessory protein CooC [Planctomycetota bacterium]